MQLTEGTAVISAEIPVKIIQEGYLSISDSFQGINLTAINKSTSDVTLNAFSAKGGKLTAKSLLDKGRLAKVDAEIASFRPLSVSHPDLQNLQTEISLVASLTQDTLKAPLKYKFGERKHLFEIPF